jgi:uncharacterized protein YjbJ (UPF0337 family)
MVLMLTGGLLGFEYDPNPGAPSRFREHDAGTEAPIARFVRRAGLEVGSMTRRAQMNWDTIEGNWKQFQGKAREQWGKLTDSDLEIAKGKRDQLAGMIQERYGIAKDEAERQVDAWERGINSPRV